MSFHFLFLVLWPFASLDSTKKIPLHLVGNPPIIIDGISKHTLLVIDDNKKHRKSKPKRGKRINQLKK